MSTPLGTEGTRNDDNEQIERDNHAAPKDPQQDAERRFEQVVNNNSDVDKDPSAYRAVGSRGYTRPSGEKNQLENLHIGGSETTPQGGNDHQTDSSKQQGSGFENEGGLELDHADNLRTREQPFGAAEPQGPATPVQE